MATSKTDREEVKPKKRGRKPKQVDLPAMTGPGVEKKTIPEIETAAENYVALRDSRIATGIEEKKAKSALLAAMHAHEVTVYEYDSKVVTVVPKDSTENVKVKVKDETEVEVGDEDEGDE